MSLLADNNEDVFQEWRQKRRVSVAPLEKRNSSDSLIDSKHSGRQQRRRSTLRGISQGITGLLSLRKDTLTKSRDEQKLCMENTYKTSPDEGMVFCRSKVRQVTEEILETELAGKTYDQVLCGRMSCDLAVKIKAQVKDLGMSRYKIVCQVIVGQVREQGLEAVSRCVWDPKTDNYECISYKNGSIFAIAMIHGVYFEWARYSRSLIGVFNPYLPNLINWTSPFRILGASVFFVFFWRCACGLDIILELTFITFSILWTLSFFTSDSMKVYRQ